MHKKRTVLTVPWLVEFLSMMDYTGPFLPCFRTALGLLLQLYRFIIHFSQTSNNVLCISERYNCVCVCVSQADEIK